MADKSSQLILGALSQAAASAPGMPLFATKAAPGLFPATAPGKQAAQRCREEGYLRILPDEDASAGAGGVATATARKGKVVERCALTEKGLTYLLGQASPRQVLEDFVRVLEARQAQLADLQAAVRALHAGMESLRAGTEKVLHQVAQSGDRRDVGGLNALYNGFRNETPASTQAAPESDAAPDAALLSLLTSWQQAGSPEDFPLPDLYRRLQDRTPAPSIGRFHDALRRLHDAGQVYLHPWTGPLYDIPEPPYALLVGHEIAYYASVRK